MNHMLFLSLLASSFYAHASTAEIKKTTTPNTRETHLIKKSADNTPIQTLILVALPGSGKSEIRKYLNSIPLDQRLKEFGVGTMAEIDDFPYVFFLRLASDEMIKLEHDGLFFLSPALPFKDPLDWGTLTHLIDEDYTDLLENKTIKTPKSAARWLFNRIDAARKKSGTIAAFETLDKKTRAHLEKKLEKDARKIFDQKVTELKKAATIKQRTVVIEFSRGGADSAPFPLPNPYGYQYALSQLSSKLLDSASILYVWVTPEESRRKNDARANPNDPGSILNHCVPRAVMYTDYGCDDIDWLLKNSDKPHTVRISKNNKTWHIPLARLDNRDDKTTFVHKDSKSWNKKEVATLHDGLAEAFSHLRA